MKSKHGHFCCCAAARIPMREPRLADDFPTKTIRVINQFGAGGGADLTARPILEKLQVALGRPVIMDNKPGGGGVIAAAELEKADPDGHTLLIDTQTLSVNTVLAQGQLQAQRVGADRTVFIDSTGLARIAGLASQQPARTDRVREEGARKIDLRHAGPRHRLASGWTSVRAGNWNQAFARSLQVDQRRPSGPTGQTPRSLLRRNFSGIAARAGWNPENVWCRLQRALGDRRRFPDHPRARRGFGLGRLVWLGCP